MSRQARISLLVCILLVGAADAALFFYLGGRFLLAVYVVCFVALLAIIAGEFLDS